MTFSHIIYVFFLIKFFLSLPITPSCNLPNCHSCYFFDQSTICKECNDTFKVSKKLHHKIRDFLQAMEQFDFNYESDYDKKATEKVCQVCFDLLDEYIKTHTNKRQKSVKLIKEMAGV